MRIFFCIFPMYLCFGAKEMILDGLGMQMSQCNFVFQTVHLLDRLCFLSPACPVMNEKAYICITVPFLI